MRRAALHRLLAGLAPACLGLPAPAGAGDVAPRAVVELFTSQGCSACPPADRLVNELARDPGVIALTLPVTYWDYLGWKDTLASTSFTARQRAYAGMRGDRQVFTPQAVVNGAATVVGSDRAALERSIRDPGTAASLPVPIRAEAGPDGLAVEVGPSAEAGRTAELWLLPVARLREVAIGRGENRGRTVTYRNVVRAMHHVGSWRGAPAHYDVPRSALAAADADSYVLVLQADNNGPGRILGAAKGPGL
ncbi:DUF1223 domain-containing protein [Methylobacterium platani]|uniref:DUF1223 domain-containing protein n=2 Tax=Methylobacterium platani TaxID=427683 RepID=A0A179S7F1_9HYPH|nr:DUF1223 domain-containing protein [Methylobacterium platani]KMO20958.1 hypothetical protein SQ03_04620 [Methylobacterium platani JCM 14648]OAS23325.1 hypothetical protein A5481_16790 [Methylobacterium platani]